MAHGGCLIIVVPGRGPLVSGLDRRVSTGQSVSTSPAIIVVRWASGWSAGPVRHGVPAQPSGPVTLRDRHCQWAGRCDQPAEACQVHHIRHKANGGKTAVTDCVLLCWFHHQIAIHRWGWTLVLNPDGTTSAWNKDKTKVLHSHGPPVRPG